MTAPLVDVSASVALMERVAAQPGRCYENALRALRLAPPGTRYVVGLWDSVAVRGAVVGYPHCWLECGDRLLEVSPAQLGALQTWAPDAHYHVIARYGAHEVERACAGVRFLLLAHEQGGPFPCSDETLRSYFAA